MQLVVAALQAQISNCLSAVKRFCAVGPVSPGSACSMALTWTRSNVCVPPARSTVTVLPRTSGTAPVRSPNTSVESDTDPVPDFAAPTSGEATVTFRAVAAQEKGEPVNARIYVGHYEARVSPIADTNPATSGAPNLDDVARFVPGTYELVANAPGYGHARFRLTLSAGSSRTVTISLPTNVASMEQGAVATGHGVEHDALIDDTEATNPRRQLF